MKTVNHLIEVIEALTKANVQYVICGGVAVVLRGVERATMDLDLAVASDQKNIAKFIDVMRHLGLEPRAPIQPEVLLDPDKVNAMIKEKGALVFSFVHPKRPYVQVDYFLTKDVSYEKLKEDIEYIPIGKGKVPVLSIEKLIELKSRISPIREKDEFDVRGLKKLLERKRESKK